MGYVWGYVWGTLWGSVGGYIVEKGAHPKDEIQRTGQLKLDRNDEKKFLSSISSHFTRRMLDEGLSRLT